MVKDCFLEDLLAVLTGFSTFPFDRAWYGEEVICSKSHSRVNVSLLTMMGMLCLTNCNFRLVSTEWDEALVSDRARNSEKLR